MDRKAAFVIFLVLALCSSQAHGQSVNAPFSNSWWGGKSLGSSYNLAYANAQIYSQGCTPYTRQIIASAQASAQASGSGSVFAQAFAQVNVVGPGLYYCYRGDTVTARASATATWARNHGYNSFGGK